MAETNDRHSPRESHEEAAARLGNGSERREHLLAIVAERHPNLARDWQQRAVELLASRLDYTRRKGQRPFDWNTEVPRAVTAAAPDTFAEDDAAFKEQLADAEFGSSPAGTYPRGVEVQPVHRLLELLHGDLTAGTSAQAELAAKHQGWNVPTPGRLALLQRLLLFADHLLDSDNAEDWELAERVDDVLRDERMLRRRVLTILEHGRRRVQWYRGKDISARRSAASVYATERIEATLETELRALRVCHRRFEAISTNLLGELLEDSRLTPCQIAAKLSLASGAFDDRCMSGESLKTALERVALSFENAGLLLGHEER